MSIRCLSPLQAVYSFHFVVSIVISLSLGLVSSQLYGQAEVLKGQQVMVIRSNVKLQLKEKVVGEVDLGEMFTVKTVNKNWIWVAKKKGWVQYQDVRPVAEVESYFSQQIQQTPTAILFEERGRVYMALGKYNLAINDFNKAQAANPKSASLLINRGHAWKKGGKIELALNDFSQAIKLNPKASRGYLNRSMIYQEQNKNDLALKDLNEAIRLNPTFSEAYNNRGSIYLKQANYRNALADFDRAIKHSPGYVLPYVNRAALFELQKNYKSAKENLNQALKLDSSHEKALNNLAWLLATCPDKTIRDGRESVEMANKAATLSAFQDWNLLETLAASYTSIGEKKLAHRWIDEALRLAPADKKSRLQKNKSRIDKGELFRH